MPGHYQHPETNGLRTLLQIDPQLAAAAKVRSGAMLLLLCDIVNLELGTDPYTGTPQQQSLRERARALFISLGIGNSIADPGPPPPNENATEEPTSEYNTGLWR